MSLAIPGAIANEPLKYKKLKTPEVTAGLFKLHTLAAFIGPRGSGKTNAAVLLARRYLDDGSLNRVFIMSPTFDSNRIFDILEPDDGDVYKNIHTCLADLDDILGKVKISTAEFEEYKEYMKIYKKWKKYEKGDGPALTIKEYNLIENNDFKPMDRVPRPSPLLIIDDMSHSDIYTPSKKNSFINLCLRHRHLFKVGISIFMLVQTFKTGIPKCLRQNIQQFFLWPTHDMSQLDSMYEEFANLCSYEDFIDMFQRCTAERHNFMSIDLNASEPLLQFRKCFDEMILPRSKLSESELQEITTYNKKKKHA
jgi:hypothetical protein